jgi:hypothetical protein
VEPAAPGPDGSRSVAPEAMTRIVLRPVASSLPLGFLAFGVVSTPRSEQAQDLPAVQKRAGPMPTIGGV